MQQLVRKYKARLAQEQLSANTIKAYLLPVYTFLNIYKRVNAENVLSYQNYLEENYSPKSVNLRIIAFNRFLSFIGKSEYRMKLLKCKQASYLDNIISFEQYRAFKSFLSKEKERKWFFIVSTLAMTGVRISELVQFGYSDVCKGYLDVKAKGNKIRRVFIPRALQKGLKEWLDSIDQTSGSVFRNNNGQSITIRGITKGLEREAKKCGLDKHLVHPHAFRHLFAKKFLEKNGDIAMLADLLGHESLDTTKIYLRKTSQEQKELIDKIVEW